MRRLTTLVILLGAIAAAGRVQGQTNLLINGDFEATPADVYFDGSDPSLADDVPGWEAFLGATDGSYVLVSLDASGTKDLDSGNGPAGGGIKTAVGSRPAAMPSRTYVASLTYDNYFAPADASYYIDWFDMGGALISSSGGALPDPNGPLVFLPYTQLLSVSGVAPATAVAAGVRLDSGNPGYAGLAADNFRLSAVQEPGSTALLAVGAVALIFGLRRTHR